MVQMERGCYGYTFADQTLGHESLALSVMLSNPPRGGTGLCKALLASVLCFATPSFVRCEAKEASMEG